MKRSKEEKEAKIINAAIKVFAERGYYESTVAEIAEEAGVASGLIYSYFKNKLDLLLTIVIEFWEELNSSIEEKTITAKGPVKKLLTVLSVIEEALLTNKQAFYMAKVLHDSLPNIFLIKEEELKEKRSRITFENKKFLNTVDKIIEEGQKQGKFDNSLKSSAMCQALYGGVELLLYGLFLKSFRSEGSEYDRGYDLSDAKKTIKRLILRFVMSENIKYNNRKILKIRELTERIKAETYDLAQTVEELESSYEASLPPRNE